MFATPNKQQKKGKFTRSGNGQGSSTQGEMDNGAGQEEMLDENVDYGRQSFPVAKLPDNFDGIPLDGEQYLAVVRQEASTHPAVFFAQHNPYLVQAPVLNVASTSALKPDKPILPSQEWRETFVLRFKAMREQALTAAPTAPITNPRSGRLPRRGNANDWYRFIHCRAPSVPIVMDVEDDAPEPVQAMQEDSNEDVQATWTPEEALRAIEAERQPSPALMRRFTTAHLLDALSIFPYWFTQPQPRAPSTSGTLQPALYALHGSWLFSILATLDHRLTSDEISTLRTLARACIAAIALHRAKRAALGRLGAQPETVLAGEQSAWCVVAAVSGVWGQHDMWDDAAASLARVT